ncbi:MAG: RIP metalloprotease RseP [Bacteroides sp.]|nr:RIP metalloprotease RseP [Bacteroides sp.]
MNALVMAGQLVLGLSILVFVHELGHYLAARMFGIRVDKFYLFFDAGGFRLLRFRIGQTEYGIGWLPLGGYCKIAGMIDESMDREALKKEPQPWEYRSKAAWKRFIVITAGVFMNLIVGILIFSSLLLHNQKTYLPTGEVNKNGIYAYPVARELGLQTGDRIIGTKHKTPQRFSDAVPGSLLLGGILNVMRDGETVTVQIPSDAYKRLAADSSGFPFIDITNYPTLVDTAVAGYPAYAAGLRKGDLIVAVNRTPTPVFGAFKESVSGHKNDSIELTALRGTDTLLFRVRTDSNGTIGILSRSPLQTKPYTASSALRYGTTDALDMMWTNIRGLGKVVSGQEKASESISGPIGIATIYGSVWNWARFWYITGMLSLVLAFMNILPIPGLDGGHMMFTLYEMVTRRKVSDRVLEKAQMIGMALLFALIILVFANDILKLFR